MAWGKMKNIRKALGNNYKSIIKDGNNCIYRDLGNGYDYGLFFPRKIGDCFYGHVYVYKYVMNGKDKNYIGVAEYQQLEQLSLDELKATMDGFAKKYG